MTTLLEAVTPVTLAQREAFARRLERATAAVEREEEGAVRALFALLRDLRNGVLAEIGAGATPGQVRAFGGLLNALDVDVATFAQGATSVLVAAQRAAWDVASEAVPDALRLAGMENPLLPIASQEQLTVLTQWGGDLIRGVSAETRAALAGPVRQAAAGVLSPAEASRRVRKVFQQQGATKGQATVKAERVVRTEVLRVYSVALQDRLEGAEAAGVVMQKKWVATRDKRTRPDHMRAHGQTVAVTGMFTVGGEKAKYPRDPRLSAKQSVLCRCTMVADVQGVTASSPVAVQVAPPPPPAPVWAQFKTLPEAEAGAKARYPNIDFDFQGMHVDTVNPTLKQFAKLADQHPEVAAKLQYIGGHQGTGAPKGRFGAGVLAEASGAQRIGLNPAFYGNPDKFRAGIKRGVDTGFHPKGTDSVEAIFSHEFGHALEHVLMLETRSVLKVISADDEFGSVNVLLNTVMRKFGRTAKDVSQYARKNPSEAWAEGFAMLSHAPRADWPVYVQRQAALLEVVQPANRLPNDAVRVVPDEDFKKNKAAVAAANALRVRLGLK